MGLDISVYKVLPLGNLNPKDLKEDEIMIIDSSQGVRDLSLACFESISFEIENDYYDLKTACKEWFDLNIEDCQWVGIGGDEDNIIYEYLDPNNEPFEIINPPIITVKDRGIRIQEINCQRKGANSLFYEDEMWSYPCITELSVLLEHWKKYFSKQTPDSKGGWGFKTEKDLPDFKMTMDFKKNIIDHFIEGECFVIYH